MRPTALSPLDGKPLLPKAVRWLMTQRRGPGWRDTQATAFAILALADYITASGELEANYTYRVELNGAELAAGSVTPGAVRTPIRPIAVGGGDLRVDGNTVRFERAGPGQLYYTILLKSANFYEQFTTVSSVDQGLSVTRSYRLAEGSARPDSAFNVGDLVEVRLGLEARDEQWYVVLIDPLPAGLEALNERMSPVSYGDRTWLPPGLPDWSWGYWGYNRKDIYDDHLAFFFNHVPPGRSEITYLARARTAGDFSALPAQAYPMYVDEVWGRSQSDQVRIAPETLAARPALAGDFDRDCRVTAFDARQAAGAWGTAEAGRDLDGDDDVDLADVAAVAGRAGATCLADRDRPFAGQGAVALSVIPSVETVAVGETFRLAVFADAAASIAANAMEEAGGVGLQVVFEPGYAVALDAGLDPALASALPLGPTIDNAAGVVALGAYAAPAGLGDRKVGEITFLAARPGAVTFRIIGAEAVDRQHRALAAVVGEESRVAVAGRAYYLPLAGR
jgi:hypothetical protein